MELIYAIPGLGTTSELFNDVSVPNCRIEVLNWPAPQSEWKLKDYASEFIPQIDLTKPVNLIGVSFGGMLCMELSELIEVKNTILVSSAKNRSEFPWQLKALRYLPLQKLFSETTYRFLISHLSWIVGFKKSYLPIFLRMVNSMPANYFKCSVNMIAKWERKISQSNVYHIHGDSDTLLPHGNVKNTDLVKGGNHAMIVYEAAKINELLNKKLNG